MNTKLFFLSLSPVVASIGLAGSWDVTLSGSHVNIGYSDGSSAPQYAVLDLNSGYMRMNYGPTSGWGTSVDVMPIFWSGGSLYQGYAVTQSHSTSGDDLIFQVDGSAHGLATHATIRFTPPTSGQLQAQVTGATTGSVALDIRSGEAFKPVFLSSMHESATVWDADTAFYGTTTVAIPSGGWLVAGTPAVSAKRFGLMGGTSTWKTNAPTTTIDLDSALQVAGWVTTSSNPNDDNVGYWAASDHVLSSWSYRVTAAAGLPTPEPASLSVLGLGSLALAYRRKISR